MTDQGRGAGGKKPKRPPPTEPETFNGNPLKLHDFLLDLRAYIASFPAATEAEKAATIARYLSGEARELYRDLLRELELRAHSSRPDHCGRGVQAREAFWQCG